MKNIRTAPIDYSVLDELSDTDARSMVIAKYGTDDTYEVLSHLNEEIERRKKEVETIIS